MKSGKTPVAGPTSQLIAGIERLGSALRAQAWSEAFARGLTPTQGQVLATLRSHDGDGLRLSELAESLNVTPATASDAVRALVSKKLVKKTQAAGDARALELSLTKAGVAEAMAVAQWPSFLLEAVDALPESEQTAMLRGVVTIISSLQQSGRIPVARICVSCDYFRANAHAGPRPHHCQFVDAAFGDRELRTNCLDYACAPAELREENIRRFETPRPKRKRRLTVVQQRAPRRPSPSRAATIDEYD